MHNHHRRFASVEDLKSAITEEFCKNVPTCNTSTCTFQVGYFQSSKHWQAKNLQLCDTKSTSEHISKY